MDNPVDVDKLYKSWERAYGRDKIVLKYPSLQGLHSWFLRSCREHDLDPEEVDFVAWVDPMVSYEANKKNLEEQFLAPPSEREYEFMAEQVKGLMQKEVRERYPQILEPLEERIVKLEAEARGKERYKRMVKELKLQLAETSRQLEELKAKPPMPALKVHILKPFAEGIMRYQPGQEFETSDLEWIRSREALGVLEQVREVIPPFPLGPEERALRLRREAEKLSLEIREERARVLRQRAESLVEEIREERRRARQMTLKA